MALMLTVEGECAVDDAEWEKGLLKAELGCLLGYRRFCISC